MGQIENFIESLAQTEVDIDVVTNLYDDSLEGGRIRQNNLAIYLQIMKELNPKVLIIGEAPGYKGCRISGIPFTSEYLMMNQSESLILGNDKGYQNINPIGKYEKEQSATIVWKELEELQNPPLIWNAFPFHPHNINNPKSNRTPTSEEVIIGCDFVKKLLDIFKIQFVGFVGRISERIKKDEFLSDYFQKLEPVYIRHPAYGGQKEFKEGISTLMKDK